MVNFKTSFNIVVGYCKNNRGIGYLNRLPWPRISEDLKHFYNITTMSKDTSKKNVVIMGRKTWESLPSNVRPLKDRLNIVITSQNLGLSVPNQDVLTFSSLDLVLNDPNLNQQTANLFVIGGQQLFESTINHPRLHRIYATEIDKDYPSDTFFPILPQWMKEIQSDHFNQSEPHLDFKIFENKIASNSDEQQYLNLLQQIIQEGQMKEGRNGNTVSLFGSPQHCFDLSKGFPLFTTKRMFFRGIIEELLFFIRGQTDAKFLAQRGVRIWGGNTTREFLDQRGLTDYQVGDMGPMYGWNWRNFGATYQGCTADYRGHGYDQLYHLIEGLVKDPNSRRHLLTTYDPSKVDESVLAPCHGLIIQFNVRDGKFLDCKMYQRSVDTALGYPFNVASYALLVHLLAEVTGYQAGRLYMTLGDVHLYESHIEDIKKQIGRQPLQFPTIKLKKKFINNVFRKTTPGDRIKFLENFEPDDIELIDYHYYPGIKMEMIA